MFGSLLDYLYLCAKQMKLERKLPPETQKQK